jgi:hypothetical protein
MKNVFFLSMIIALIIGSCVQKEVKSPIEGAWKLVGLYSPQYTSTSYDDIIKNGQIKTWSKEYFTWVGHSELDTVAWDGYGAGTYVLNGNQYEESIIYLHDKTLINKKFKALLEIKNDTLFQKYNNEPIGDSYELRDGFTTEVYVRLK